ncbi:MAG TPA: hypothetical protein DCS97_06915 [Planctomycetes bacterium]|nr:hypothetical protein [Planctomycetota bacterium]
MTVLRIPLEAPSQNNLGGRTWRARAGHTKTTRANWRMMAASQMILLAIPKATGPRRLHIIAYRKQRCRDIANLIGGMKACIDGLVDAGLLVDDRDGMASITYEQGVVSTSPTGHVCTLIHVDDITTPAESTATQES